MQIMINIPDAIKEMADEGDKKLIHLMWMIILVDAIKNGIVLPKGHGRLKDVDWIDDNCPDYRTEDGAWCYKWEDIDNAPTIIEAESEG